MSRQADNPGHYDIIIAGGGLAGLSLAYAISTDVPTPDLRILLLEKDQKNTNDRTWCFWTERPSWFEALAAHSWKNILITAPGYQEVFPLKNYTYYKLESKVFYQHIQNRLAADTRFTSLQTTVHSVRHQEGEERVQIETEAGVFTAGHVFDSLFLHEDLKEWKQGRLNLLQHFKGWTVVFDEPMFDPSVAQMFDFGIPQDGEVRFIYVLPESDREALVEFTLFSDNLLPEADYTRHLEEYMRERFRGRPYRITATEGGIIPMTDYAFPMQTTNRWYFVGTKAGMCKPSTGYAFLRTQRDSTHIARALREGKAPGHYRRLHWRFWWYDTMMLGIMAEDGGRIRDLFRILFHRNGVRRMFRFLDDRTHFGEELQVMASVPPAPFLHQLFKILSHRLKNRFKLS